MADQNIEMELAKLTSIAQQILESIAGTGDPKKAADGEEKQRTKNIDGQRRLTAQVNTTADAVMNVGKEFFSIAAAGAKLANSLGQTVTQGIRQEFSNRMTVVSQILNADADRIVSSEQLISAQQALTSTFVSVGEGMAISDEGVTAFAQSLKGGFKSDFKLTGDSMRALITAGVATESGFENLRKSSGRASLSNDQLSRMVSKNSLSFMLYGPKFAKAAAEAEKLGINLAGVQSAQESMVSNIDGTLDTLNQVNQLGAQIDFGTLMRLNEFEGPEATLKYLQSTIPPALFQSASTRALLKGFGIATEDLMKGQGSAQAKAAKTMEDAMTKIAPVANAAATFLAELYTKGVAVTSTIGSLITSMGGATAAFIKLAMGIGGTKAISLVAKSIAMQSVGAGVLFSAGTAAAGGGTGNVTDKITSKGAGAGSILKGLGAGLRQLAVGFRAFANPMVAGGVAVITLAIIGLGVALRIAAPGIVAVGMAIKSTLEGVASVVVSIGTAIGTVVTAAGTAISGIFKTLSTMSPLQLAGIAASMGFLGVALAGFGVTGLVAVPALIAVTNRMNALSNSASGVQTLSTSFKELVATIDTLKDVDLSKLKELNASVPKVSGGASAAAAIAATVKTTTGGTRTTAPENSDLIKKIDELIRVLRESRTVINIDNKSETVPRQALAGVYVRNQRV
jgi:hypothetical protein